MPQALPRVTIDARGEALNWQAAPTHANTTAGYGGARDIHPIWRPGDELTGGTILPRLMVCFSIQPFATGGTPESYQLVLEDLMGELLELGGSDPRPGGTWERHVLRAEFQWCSPTKLFDLMKWWVEKAAFLTALSHLDDAG